MRVLPLVIVWILVLVLNIVYGFLPSKHQAKWWVRVAAIVIASVILLHGVYGTIRHYQSQVFAHVSANGTVLKSKNFPWKITRATTEEGNVVYVINERYGDSSEISIVPDEPIEEYSIYNVVDGVCIRFTGPEKRIPGFKIRIGK